ncbi:MAG TPA: chemotaxis-specific protein-glutamate methyltransferase CheB, partial [Leptospiraceae bacterium]|nr:chemotaxis-specific protein-glutamate methyltransferase CheB [Leptospiraceae bacterium]
MNKKILVAVVDDSAVVRQVFTEMLKHPDVNLLFTANDPIFAMEKMEKAWPDVIILDVEMPRMDGISFLRKLMRERPTPVIICSTLTQDKSELTLQALSAGAVEVIAKPTLGLKGFLTESAEKIIEAIKTAASANLKSMQKFMPMETSPQMYAVKEKKFNYNPSSLSTTDKVVAIGTSAGGTIALEAVLPKLRPDCHGIVIVQHMPEKFTAAFAKRLNALCEVEVKEAENGDPVLRGHVLIAPGDRHLLLERQGARYVVSVRTGPLVSRHRPSVDVLLALFPRQTVIER